MFTIENIKEQQLSVEDIKKILIENPDKLYLDMDGEGGVILDYAIWWDCIELLKFLINELNVDIFRKDNNGNTAMFSAIQKESLVILKILIENGANVKEKNFEGNSLLHELVFYVNIVGATSKRIDILNFLLKNGINVNEKNLEGETPFTIAIDIKKNNKRYKKDKDTIRFLDIILSS